MSNPADPPQNRTESNAKRDKSEIPPVVFRSEFEAFTEHYNTNMEKALDTVTELQYITSRVLNRENFLLKVILGLFVWNIVLTVAVGFLVWRVFV